jgi:5'-nucleotidase
MRWIRSTALGSALSLLALTGPAPVQACDDDHGEDSVELREAAAHRIAWRSDADDGGGHRSRTVHVKLLGINDFHGHLASGGKVGGKPVGGAAWLTTYLKEAQKGVARNTIIVHAGDHVGASPPESALLADEPSISFLNLLANEECSYRERFDPDCNLVGTSGNHEYDHGYQEMFRQIYGGNSAQGPFLENPWRGARYPMVVSNVVYTRSGHPILPPYVVKHVEGVPIAFIGAVLRATPTIVSAAGIHGLTFLDEPTAINKYVRELKREGIHAFVVTIHQGGFQAKTYTGSTDTSATAPALSGDILDVINRLDDDVDVVVSGHTHAFTNAIVENQNHKPILVTQAFSYGTAYADVDLTVDRRTRDVVAKSASIVTTYQARADGTPVTPDAQVATLVQQAVDRVAPLVSQVVGSTTTDITRTQNAAGESTLGDLIADSQRAEMATDFAFMNPGGVRADLLAGSINWGQLFTVQPFGNALVKMTLSGQQIHTLLEQQWVGQASPRMLQISGLSYTWDASKPDGSKVSEVRKAGTPIDKAASYTATVNNFMAGGGDNFVILKEGTNLVGGPLDLDAFIHYVAAHSPLTVAIDGRAVRLN